MRTFNKLGHAIKINLLTHYTKGTLSHFFVSIAYKFINFSSFHFSFSKFFSPFPHGTFFSIDYLIYLDFEGGPPIFK